MHGIFSKYFSLIRIATLAMFVSVVGVIATSVFAQFGVPIFPLLPFPAPTGLHVTNVDWDKVELAWDAYTPPGKEYEYGLQIEVRDNTANPRGNDGDFVSIARIPVALTTYVHDKALAPENDYEYRIFAYKKKTEEGGKSSDTALAKTLAVNIRRSGSERYHTEYTEPSPLYSQTETFSKEFDFRRNTNGLWSDASPPKGLSSEHIISTRGDFNGAILQCGQSISARVSCTDSVCPIGIENGGVPGDTCVSTPQTTHFNSTYPMENAANERNDELFIPSVSPDQRAFAQNPDPSVENLCSVSAGFVWRADDPAPTFERRLTSCADQTHLKQSEHFNWSCVKDDTGSGGALQDRGAGFSDTIVTQCRGDYPKCVESVTNQNKPTAACTRCTDPGSGYDPIGTKDIRISDIIPGSIRYDFAEDFVQEAETKRLFTPSLPFTPFDDFYVELKIKICPKAGAPAPGALSLKGSILVSPPGKSAVAVVLPPDDESAQFIKFSETATEATYRWTLRGWSNNNKQSIVNRLTADNPGTYDWEKRVEFFVDAIVKKQPIKVVITENTGSASIEKPITFDSCVHVWGKDNAPHKFVDMRGSTAIQYRSILGLPMDFTMTVTGMVAQTEENRNGYNSIDPFRAYIKKFSFYSDLKNHDDGMWESEMKIFFTTVRGPVLTYNAPIKTSSCNQRIGMAKEYHLYHNFSAPANRTIATFGKKITYMYAGRGNSLQGKVTVHESGHNFAGLDDEYGYGRRILTTPLIYSNCVSRPDAYFRSPFNSGPLYGDINYQECMQDNYFRPSNDSLMRYGTASFLPGQFNVVSCGYIMKAILGVGKARDYWPTCMNKDWNTIKPTAPVAPAPLPLPLPKLAPSPAVSPSPAQGSTPSPIPSPSPAPPSPAAKGTAPGNGGNSGVSPLPQSLVFLNLKANGTDGPLAVSSGQSVTLTWNSSFDVKEGSCIGTNFAVPSGLRQGPPQGVSVGVSFPTTFTITCELTNNDIISDSVSVTLRRSRPQEF